ncbi:hypothetical protein ACO2Q8_20280 [Larkinella sp. VNQ87]|uniref:hypothetical protein n=1 Tax=Larkinella sp. VNQ87 TaxID=3400921 RepID=UPI003C0198D4
MKNKRILGVFLRWPSPAEWLIFGMSVVLLFFAVVPSLPAKLYQISGVGFCLSFFVLFLREAQSEMPRYFYKWLWALFGIVKLNSKLVSEIFVIQTWQLFDVVVIVVLLRSIHTYNLENERQPLFFRRVAGQ